MLMSMKPRLRKKTFKNIHSQVENTRREMRNLTQLRIREQIDDELFDEEKKRIQKELKRLESLLTETSRQADEWVELMKETFDFAFYARVHFTNGDLQKKRYIFSKLGSNFLFVFMHIFSKIFIFL